MNTIKKCADPSRKTALLTAAWAFYEKLGDYKFVENFIESLKGYCSLTTSLDVKNPSWIVCQNGAYNLVEGKLMKPDRCDFVSNNQQTSFAWEPENPEKMNFLWKIINKYFPDREQRDVILTYMSTILDGLSIKKFLVNLGMYEYLLNFVKTLLKLCVIFF